MLRLGDKARRAEFTNLRALASGFHVDQRTAYSLLSGSMHAATSFFQWLTVVLMG